MAPDVFATTVAFFQTPTMIYVAAALRVAIGVVLILAAAGSRVPIFLRLLGGFIIVGGALTPFFGARYAYTILDWWKQEGPGLVRVFAIISLLLGVLTLYALTPRRRETN